MQRLLVITLTTFQPIHYDSNSKNICCPIERITAAAVCTVATDLIEVSVLLKYLKCSRPLTCSILEWKWNCKYCVHLLVTRPWLWTVQCHPSDDLSSTFIGPIPLFKAFSREVEVFETGYFFIPIYISWKTETIRTSLFSFLFMQAEARIDNYCATVVSSMRHSECPSIPACSLDPSTAPPFRGILVTSPSGSSISFSCCKQNA